MAPKKKQESGEQTLTRIAIVSGDRCAAAGAPECGSGPSNQGVTLPVWRTRQQRRHAGSSTAACGGGWASTWRGGDASCQQLGCLCCGAAGWHSVTQLLAGVARTFARLPGCQARAHTPELAGRQAAADHAHGSSSVSQPL